LSSWSTRSVPDHAQGPQLASIQALCEYWATEYDWRRCEIDLNGLGSSRTVIDGLGIHFLHIASPEPTATPLLLAMDGQVLCWSSDT